MDTIKVHKSSYKYSCECCNYITVRKGQYERHLNTPKHMRIQQNTQNGSSVINAHICDHCGNEYKFRSGLWKHKKHCTYASSLNNEDPPTDSMPDDHYIIVELLKQNQEFKDLILEERREFQQIIKEMAGNMGNNTVNNNNNTNINSNNKFNLNVFLNEKCKNAMTLKDFVKSINISVQDFIETGERGFIDGISNIIVERINEMEIHDRPLHCTDLKRETVYIKDENKWEKDEDKVKLRKAVKGVAYKNERMRPVWYDSTPDVGIMGTENYEKFFKYSESSLGGCGREETELFEDKVMKNVMKEVTIDKTKAIE